jgi:hypothetical protein
MFKKDCLRGKEHFNLPVLILGSLPTGGFLFPTVLPTQAKQKVQILVEKFWEPFLAENSLMLHIIPSKSITIFPKMKIFFLETTLKIGRNVLFRPQTSHIFH